MSRMILLTLLTIYCLVGLLFGVAFFLRGYAALEPAARGVSLVTRLLWTPAAVALWPYLLKKWIEQRS